MWKINGILSKDECQLAVSEFDRMKDDLYVEPQDGSLRNRLNPGFGQECCFEVNDGTNIKTWTWYNSPVLNRYLPKVESFVNQYIDLSYYKFSNNYVREYVKHTRLEPHIDNPGLDITLSVCLSHDFDGQFTLNVYNLNNTPDQTLEYDITYRQAGPAETLAKYLQVLDPTQYTRIELAEGDGALVFGRQRFHYRDTFPANGNRGIYVFYHWTRF